jgi:hypothetical protein
MCYVTSGITAAWRAACCGCNSSTDILQVGAVGMSVLQPCGSIAHQPVTAASISGASTPTRDAVSDGVDAGHAGPEVAVHFNLATLVGSDANVV